MPSGIAFKVLVLPSQICFCCVQSSVPDSARGQVCLGLYTDINSKLGGGLSLGLSEIVFCQMPPRLCISTLVNINPLTHFPASGMYVWGPSAFSCPWPEWEQKCYFEILILSLNVINVLVY